MTVSALLSRILRTSMYLSMALLLIGTVGMLLHTPTLLNDPAAYLTALRAGQPLGFIAAGLAVLTLGPLCGVAIAVYGYLRRAEYRFALVALGVLLITIATLFVHPGR